MPESIDPDPSCLVPPSDDAGVEDPLIPLPPGLRDIRLTDREAWEIENLLDSDDQPKHSGREMPTADASALQVDIETLLLEGMNSGEAVEVNDAFWQERRRILRERIAARKAAENP